MLNNHKLIWNQTMALQLWTYSACTLHRTCHACKALHTAWHISAQTQYSADSSAATALTEHGGLITENKDF